MSESKIEFKRLNTKCIGTDTVVFRLEDGATVKVKMDLERAGIAVDYKNPDGTPHYQIGPSVKVTVIPSEKSYYLPKSSLKKIGSKEKRDIPFIR